MGATFPVLFLWDRGTAMIKNDDYRISEMSPAQTPDSMTSGI